LALVRGRCVGRQGDKGAKSVLRPERAAGSADAWARPRRWERGLLVATAGLAHTVADAGRDPVASLETFIVDCLRAWPLDRPLEAPALAQVAAATLGIPVPPANVVTRLLWRLDKRGLVVYSRRERTFKPHREALLELPPLAVRRDAALRRMDSLFDALVEFAKANRVDWSRDEATEALILLIEEFAADLAAARARGIRPLPPQPADATLKLVYRFARWSLLHVPANWEAIEDMLRGSMCLNLLYLGDIDAVSSRLPDLRVALDTPLVLPALEVAAEPPRVAMYELLDQLRAVGAGVFAYRHTVEEVQGVLESIAAKMRRGHDPSRQRSCRQTETIDALRAKGIGPTDLDELSANIYDRLEKVGIGVRDTPPHAEERHIDEGKLDAVLDEVVNYSWHGPREKDLRTLAAIDRERGDSRPDQLEQATILFVTDNARLARASRKFFAEADRSAAVRHCVLDLDLAAQLWVRVPTAAPSLPRTRLIATCWAANDFPESAWDRCSQHIVRLQEGGDVSPADLHDVMCGAQARAVTIEPLDWQRDSDEVARLADPRREALPEALPSGQPAEPQARPDPGEVERLRMRLEWTRHALAVCAPYFLVVLVWDALGGPLLQSMALIAGLAPLILSVRAARGSKAAWTFVAIVAAAIGSVSAIHALLGG